MVFTTMCSFMRQISQKSKGPERVWRKRKILKMSAHFSGRAQNCYTIAIRAVMKALKYTTKSRQIKHIVRDENTQTRLSAACEEHGFTYPHLKESLIRSNILLNKKVLVDLAIWEPRTFKCITDFAWTKAKSENLKGIDELGTPPSGVLLKPMPPLK